MLKYILVAIVCVPSLVQARIHTILNADTISALLTPHPKPTNKRSLKVEAIISEAATRHNVDEKLVHAIIKTESSYVSTAVSSKGAVGYMQLMPNTAIRFGCNDRNDPIQNINSGTKYLKYLITLFDSNLTLVVAAYNAGENAVIKYDNKIPPYPETQQYVTKVLSNLAKS